MTEKKKQEKVELIYEKLAPGEILIISKKGNCITYAANEKGKVVFKEACFTKED
jgi:hypothetical protein